jgi:DNA-binding CsgD family transcriptional regulator
MIHKLLACRQSAAKRVARLTPREREVLQMVLAGHPSKNIAADLDISQRTVESHRAAIMKKTGSKCLPALARLALAAGWSDMQVPWAPADACNMDHPDPVSAGPPQASGCHGSTTRLDALGTNPTIDLLLMYGGVVAGFISPHDMPGPRSGPTRHLAKHGGDAWVPSSSSSC